MKTLKDPKTVRNKMTTLRLNELEDNFIESMKEKLAEMRPVLGAAEPTKTEALQVLLAMGMEAFSAKYGDPRKKAKKKIS